MTIFKLGSAMLLSMVLLGCGDDPVGGRCTTKDGTCFVVSNPTNYHLKTECEAFGSTWASGTCDPTQFKRKCTQMTQAGSPPQTVTYVYFYPESVTTACAGTEENL
jgi:hypothetical protein